MDRCSVRGILLSLSLKPTTADMSVGSSSFQMIAKREVRSINAQVAERLFALIMRLSSQ